jgi:hypothetical protein
MAAQAATTKRLYDETVDPRNFATIVDAPPHLVRQCPSLAAALLYLVCPCRKLSRFDALLDRTLVLTDECIYLAHPVTGEFRRCVRIHHVAALEYDKRLRVGIRFSDVSREHSMVLFLEEKDHVNMLKRIIYIVKYQHHEPQPTMTAVTTVQTESFVRTHPLIFPWKLIGFRLKYSLGTTRQQLINAAYPQPRDN